MRMRVRVTAWKVARSRIQCRKTFPLVSRRSTREGTPEYSVMVLVSVLARVLVTLVPASFFFRRAETAFCVALRAASRSPAMRPGEPTCP